MNDLKTLTVYLGSSGHCRQIFKDSAAALGHFIADNAFNLVYGGMDAGLMGVLAKTAHQNGAHVTGIVPQKLKDSQRILEGLNTLIMVEDLWDRKKRMFDMADAVIALPGGFGTLDECLEMLHWAHLKLHNKPLVMLNIDGYWNTLMPYLQTLDDYDERYVIVVDTIEDIVPALQNWTPVVIPPDVDYHFPHFEDEICRRTYDPIMIDIASVENTYYAICALGLKQLGKHARGIGFINQGDQFSALHDWIKTAHQERFITDKCVTLYGMDTDRMALYKTLFNDTRSVLIDLHQDKWGASVQIN